MVTTSVAIPNIVVPGRVVANPRAPPRVVTTKHYDVPRLGEHALDNYEAAGSEVSLNLIKGVGVRGVILETKLDGQVSNNPQIMAVQIVVIAILEETVGHIYPLPRDLAV